MFPAPVPMTELLGLCSVVCCVALYTDCSRARGLGSIVWKAADSGPGTEIHVTTYVSRVGYPCLRRQPFNPSTPPTPPLSNSFPNCPRPACLRFIISFSHHSKFFPCSFSRGEGRGGCGCAAQQCTSHLYLPLTSSFKVHTYVSCIP
ncbi:hypothetical protein DFH27DRAFT_317035 [Peziza echinospora]|nr:hypothetical protein DFH27DRAFT_317035 [Peziza echinospora]